MDKDKTLDKANLFLGQNTLKPPKKLLPCIAPTKIKLPFPRIQPYSKSHLKDLS